MTTDPTISIVTISYNQGQFLEKTIRSVLDQGYSHLEYVVIDGGSTDHSVDIIRKYEDRLAYWISEPDRGQSHALNKGFERCSGHLLGWLNSDDYFLPGALEAFAAAWREDPRAGAWVGDAQLVYPDGKIYKLQQPGPLHRDAIADWEVNGFSQPACLFSRAAWEACKPIDETLYIPMDFDLWMKMARDFTFRRIPSTLAAATIHPEAKTQAQVNLKHVEMWLVMIRYGYIDLAKRKMLEALERMDDLQRKVDKLTRVPGYGLIRPLVKSFLGPNPSEQRR